MAIKKNKVKLDLCSYPHYVIMGLRKIGKTSFFHELVIKYTGSVDGGLLISCGNEDGFNHLEDIQYEEARDWDKEPDEEIEDDDRGLVQIADDLVENRNTTYAGIKLLGFDTLDELVEIARQQVFLEHRRLKGETCKSLNDALGGYGKGRERLVDLINEQISRLNRAGYAVFVIAHTKNKVKEDLLTERKFDVITNNLNDDIFGGVADKAQMIVNIVYDREIKEEKNSKNKVVGGQILSSKRMMYFRDANGLVDAGGRFEGLPEKLELSAENFLKAFEIGVENARKKTYTVEETTKQKEEEIKELEKDRKKLVNKENQGNTARKTDLINDIRANVKSIMQQNQDNSTIVGTKLKELGLTIKTLDTATLDVLKDFNSWLKETF